jgi:hypothetical protein
MERLFNNLKTAEIWRRQLKNLLTVITKEVR